MGHSTITRFRQENLREIITYTLCGAAIFCVKRQLKYNYASSSNSRTFAQSDVIRLLIHLLSIFI